MESASHNEYNWFESRTSKTYWNLSVTTSFSFPLKRKIREIRIKTIKASPRIKMEIKKIRVKMAIKKSNNNSHNPVRDNYLPSK